MQTRFPKLSRKRWLQLGRGRRNIPAESEPNFKKAVSPPALPPFFYRFNGMRDVQAHPFRFQQSISNRLAARPDLHRGAKRGSTLANVRASQRQVNTMLAATPLRRATSVTLVPHANVFSTIRALSLCEQHLPRSSPPKSSIRIASRIPSRRLCGIPVVRLLQRQTGLEGSLPSDLDEIDASSFRLKGNWFDVILMQ